MADIEVSLEMLSRIDSDCDQLSPRSSPGGCPALTDSFWSSQPSDMYIDTTRRSSFASSATSHSPLSNSPGWYSFESTTTSSPATPMTAMTPFSSDGQQMKIEHGPGDERIRNVPQNGLPELDFWMGQEDIGDMLHLTNMAAVPLMDVLGTSHHPSYCATYPQYPRTVSMSNPSLSRPIFDVEDSMNATLAMPVEKHSLRWSAFTSSPPQTIAPCAAFQPMLMSSPVTKHEPSTPLRRGAHSPTMFSSSPLGLVSPPVVPSQHDVEEAKYEPAEHAAVASELVRHRTGVERLHRRGYERKRHVGPDSRAKSAASRSGIHCDVVIAQNEFACSYPGCVDKTTGKPKRFKRQEHKKRHEKTVHEKNRHVLYHCWVPECTTAPFTRTDNLKSHLKNTHGKKSANQRNRYVATQDMHSECYDPDWRGDLTEDGYPILLKDARPIRSKI